MLPKTSFAAQPGTRSSVQARIINILTKPYSQSVWTGNGIGWRYLIIIYRCRPHRCGTPLTLATLLRCATDRAVIRLVRAPYNPEGGSGGDAGEERDLISPIVPYDAPLPHPRRPTNFGGETSAHAPQASAPTRREGVKAARLPSRNDSNDQDTLVMELAVRGIWGTAQGQGCFYVDRSR